MCNIIVSVFGFLKKLRVSCFDSLLPGKRSQLYEKGGNGSS